MSIPYTSVALVAGGSKGKAGRAYVYAPEYGLGRAFEDPADLDTVVAHLLDDIEGIYGIKVVSGSLETKWANEPQGELNLGDERTDPDFRFEKYHPSRSQAARQGKRHTQQYTTPGSHED